MKFTALLRAAWCCLAHYGGTRCDKEGCPFYEAPAIVAPPPSEHIRIVPANEVLAPIVCPACSHNFEGNPRYALVSTDHDPQPFLDMHGKIIVGFERGEIGLYAANLNRTHDQAVAQVLELWTCCSHAAEAKRLHDLIHTPHTVDFLEAVQLEAAFQIDKWGTEHDAGKEPQDFYWLLAYLSGKGLRAAIDLEKELKRSGVIDLTHQDKALHHTISSAAVLLNWHRRISGDETAFQPGTDNGNT